MGLHVMHADRDDLVRAYIDKVRPTVVKWLDDPGGNDIVQYAKDRGALTVLRVYESDQQLSGNYIGRVVSAMQQWPAFAVGESLNEDFQTPPEAARRAEFDIELMKAMDRIGRKAGILCASTGQPEMSFWPDYLPAIRYAAEHGHYVCLHEYGGGPVGMLWGVGQNQHPWNNRVDKPENAAARGWWVLRYRRHVDEWRRLGLTTIPRIYIGEGGIDDIWPRPGHGGKGYKDYINEHPAGVGDYAEQWAWTCRRWAEDSYMVGGVDFGFASRDPQWGSFDMATDPATLADVQATMAALAGTPTPTPIPVPPPPPPGGNPMFDVEILEEAGRRQVIQLQPDAALQKAIEAAGFWPTSPEYRQQTTKGLVMALRAEHPRTGEVRVYWCPWGKWSEVAFVRRPGATPAPVPAPLPPGGYKIVPGSYTEHRWARPAGAKIGHIILHDPVGGTVDGTLGFLRHNADQVGYHEMMDPEGRLFILAPPEQWTGHAGVSTRIPGTDIVNGAVNHNTYSHCLFKAASDGGPFPIGQVAATVARVADLIKQFGLPDAGCVLAHREVSTEPGRRSDPRGLDMAVFRAAVQARLG